jgi:hypothetical protein
MTKAMIIETQPREVRLTEREFQAAGETSAGRSPKILVNPISSYFCRGSRSPASGAR